MNELGLGVNDPLAATTDTVARMTRPQREARVAALMDQSHDFLSAAIEEHVTNDGRMLAAVVGLFSGGNDSTTLMHLFRDRLDYAAHANTTIGIEQTRDFVRNTCEVWGLPLIERTAPREQDRYRAQVLRDGFPGPAWHVRMYQRLKERALEQVRNELVANPRRERVVFAAGRRRDESSRRRAVPLSERRGSIVWVSPLIHWTKLDLTTYRLMRGDVPANQVSDLIHMSGECLCGSFAAPGEREEVAYWFPDVFDEVAALEAEIADRDDIPAHRKTWGWGADPALKALDGPARSVGLCSTCDDQQSALFEVAIP